MNDSFISTEELLATNPELKALWIKDGQIRSNQPMRTSEDFMTQALEMKRVAGLRASSLKKSSSSSGAESMVSLEPATI